MTDEGTCASDMLVDALVTTDGEFVEVEEEYGCDLQQQIIIEDPDETYSSAHF